MKQLTVITVTFNAERCVEKTLRSVIGQTVYEEQIEYIIVDGASKDDTVEIVKQFGDKISHIISEPDKGIYDAMNKGIRLATAPWICFMNADDTFYDEHTVEQLHLEDRAKDSILYGSCVFKLQGGRQELRQPIPFWQNPDKCSGIGICHQATITPTAWMKEMPFDTEHYRYCNDYDFMYRCWKMGRRFLDLGQPICLFEWGTGFSSNPAVSQRIFDENVRIAGCRFGYWYWRHQWRTLKKRLFRC